MAGICGGSIVLFVKRNIFGSNGCVSAGKEKGGIDSSFYRVVYQAGKLLLLIPYWFCNQVAAYLHINLKHILVSQHASRCCYSTCVYSKNVIIYAHPFHTGKLAQALSISGYVPLLCSSWKSIIPWATRADTLWATSSLNNLFIFLPQTVQLRSRYDSTVFLPFLNIVCRDNVFPIFSHAPQIHLAYSDDDYYQMLNRISTSLTLYMVRTTQNIIYMVRMATAWLNMVLQYPVK